MEALQNFIQSLLGAAVASVRTPAWVATASPPIASLVTIMGVCSGRLAGARPAQATGRFAARSLHRMDRGAGQ